MQYCILKFFSQQTSLLVTAGKSTGTNSINKASCVYTACILTCQSRKSTGVNNNIVDCCVLLKCPCKSCTTPAAEANVATLKFHHH